MKDLIEALTIFAKYRDEKWPTHCEHDVLTIMGIGDEVSEADKDRLAELGFIWSTADGGAWISFRFGSA
jgi:hypothetical protein